MRVCRVPVVCPASSDAGLELNPQDIDSLRCVKVLPWKLKGAGYLWNTPQNTDADTTGFHCLLEPVIVAISSNLVEDNTAQNKITVKCCTTPLIQGALRDIVPSTAGSSKRVLGSHIFPKSRPILS